MGAVKGLWLYACFIIIKKVCITASMRMTDDAVNAAFSSVWNTIDMLLIICLRPFSDNAVVVSNAISAVCISLVSFGLLMPATGNFTIYIGDPMIVALTTLSTAVSTLLVSLHVLSTLSSAMSSFFKLVLPCVSGSYSMIFQVTKSAGASAGGAVQVFFFVFCV